MFNKDEVKDLIELNRQTGQTTALVEAAIKTKGVLIVATMQIGMILRSKYPELNFATINELQTLRGKKQAIFFDNTAVSCLCSPSKKLKEEITLLINKL